VANFFVTGLGGTPLRDFADTTKRTAYASWGQLFNKASDGDVLTISPIPLAFGKAWPNPTGIGLNNSVINFLAGVKFADVQTSKGILVLGGKNLTLHGDPKTLADFNGAIRVSDNALNPTLVNLRVHDGCAVIGTSCILTGNNTGTVTLKNVFVSGGGDSAHFGQDHNVYVSANGSAVDNAANVQIDMLVSLDVTNSGWSLKMRPGGVTTPNVVKNSVIGCTKPNCEQNGVVDMPCGGNYIITHSVLERGPSGDNWHLVRAGEETLSAGNCPGAYNGTIILDTDWLIWDGPCPGAAARGQAVLLCAGRSDCTIPGYTPTLVVKNSKIVSDPTGCALVFGPKVQDSGGNTKFVSRAAAGLAPWPYLPPHL